MWLGCLWWMEVVIWSSVPFDWQPTPHRTYPCPFPHQTTCILQKFPFERKQLEQHNIADRFCASWHSRVCFSWLVGILPHHCWMLVWVSAQHANCFPQKLYLIVWWTFTNKIAKAVCGGGGGGVPLEFWWFFPSSSRLLVHLVGVRLAKLKCDKRRRGR